MSRLKECSVDLLEDRAERAQAKLARIARGNVYFGGASALMIARRLNAMGTALPVDDIVSAAYASNTGNAVEYLSYECPECGRACLGETAAMQCCHEEPCDEEFPADDWQ